MPYVKHFTKLGILTNVLHLGLSEIGFIVNKQAWGNVLGNLGLNFHSRIRCIILLNIFVSSLFKGWL